MATKTAGDAAAGSGTGTGTREDDETKPTTATGDGADGTTTATGDGADGTTTATGDGADETNRVAKDAGVDGVDVTGEDGGARDADSEASSGVGLGAGAVVSAALGLVSLSGSWIGTVAAAREQLVGQLRTSTSASVGTQLKEVYGDSWHTTALWAGLFALAALVTGVVVLVRPAFGAPGRPRPAWIRSAAWAGVSLGVVGLLLAVLKYSDALLGLPSAG
ncbi:hypothetical protein ACH4L5_31240 [Streptomyces sp. NPDC017405]|uniref:hypothetical protein n=1 Tax=unclassified Streptomyces TaxID=2593676 RepID=UPI0037A28794